MKVYAIEQIKYFWSSSVLKDRVERRLNELSQEGYEIVSVSFGLTALMYPTAFITIAKDRAVK